MSFTLLRCFYLKVIVIDSEPRMPRNKMKEYDDEIDNYKSKQSRFNIGRITKDKGDESDESPQEYG